MRQGQLSCPIDRASVSASYFVPNFLKIKMNWNWFLGSNVWIDKDRDMVAYRGTSRRDMHRLPAGFVTCKSGLFVYMWKYRTIDYWRPLSQLSLLIRTVAGGITLLYQRVCYLVCKSKAKVIDESQIDVHHSCENDRVQRRWDQRSDQSQAVELLAKASRPAPYSLKRRA